MYKSTCLNSGMFFSLGYTRQRVSVTRNNPEYPAAPVRLYAKFTLTISVAYCFAMESMEAYPHVHNCIPGLCMRFEDASSRVPVDTRGIRGRAAYKIFRRRILRRARIFFALSRVPIFASARPRPGAFGAARRGRTLSRHVRITARKTPVAGCMSADVSFRVRLRVFVRSRAAE